MSTHWYEGGLLPAGRRPPMDRTAAELAQVRQGEYAQAVPVETSLSPVLIPRRSYDELVRAALGLLHLLRRALLGSGPTAGARLAALGTPADAYPLLFDTAMDDAYATCIARPDAVVTTDGLKFVEFNIGSGIGGVVDTWLHTAAWVAAFGGAADAPFDAVDPLSVRDDLLVRAVHDLGVQPAVALIGSFRDYPPECPGFFELQAASLRSRGLKAELFEPEQLPEAVGPAGTSGYGLGFRHFTVPEWRAKGIPLDPVRAAADRGLKLLAPETSYLIANKKVLGWVSAGLPWMRPADRELVDRYLPWTRVTQDRRVHWRGRGWALPDLLVEQQWDFVLKPAIGMSGKQVLIGRECSPATWRQAVQEATAAEDHVVQEYVAALPYPMLFSRGEGTDTDIAPVLPVFSPFLFDHRDGGCMVRYLPPDRQGVVSIHGHGALSNVAMPLR